MSKTKTLNVYYYKVTPKVMEADYISAQNELTSAFLFPSDKKYENILQTHGEVGLFGDRVVRRNLIFGTFAFTQTENIPPKQNKLSKNTKELELGDDDGLGYQTSFVFDRLTNIIGIVNRRPGVAKNSIEKFVKHNFDTPNFSLEMVATKSSMENFLRTGSYKKMSIKISNPTQIESLLDSKNETIVSLRNIVNRFESGKINFEVTANTNESLSLGAVRDTVNFFKRNLFSNVDSLTVTGNDDSIEEKTFNFISNRIQDKITVEIGRHGNFRTREVYEQLEIKFDENSLYLREVYTNKNVEIHA